LRAYIEKRLNEGVGLPSVILDVVAKNYDLEDAQKVVKEVLDSEKNKYFKILAITGGLGLLGAMATVSALESGDGYIWYGVIIMGLIGVIYSVSKLVKLK
jgi:uncharacterized membrane protein YjjP (DUF1212 family)